MVDEKQIEEDLKKDINQEDSISPEVEAHLQEMGYLWDKVQDKFQKDNICFKCKQPVKGKKTYVLEANKIDKGVIAFVCICSDCYNEELEKEKVKNE
jgi:hypothetical protein